MSTTNLWASSTPAVSGRSWGDLYGWRTDNQNVYQGDWGYGHYKGLWFFDNANIRTVLAGQRILGIRVRITRIATSHGSSSAGTPTLRLHNYSSQPSGEPTMQSGTSSHGVSFSLGDQKWVTLPVSWGEALRDGNSRGLGLYTTSNSPYLIFDDYALLEVTFEPLLNAPPTPSGFTLTGSTATTMSMTCNTAGSAGSNNLATTYRWDREGGGTATTSGTSFTNGGLPAGLTDRWRVRAENAAGVSAYTGYLTGKTNPPTPTGLAQTGATTSSISMWWSLTTGAELYRVQRSSLTTIHADTARSTTDTGLVAGSSYQYRVRAENVGLYNTGGNSDWSANITMYTLCPTPGAPTLLNVAHNSIDLTWSSVAGASSYKVYRNASGGAYSLVRTQTGTTWTNTGLTAGVTYGYYIVAVNAGGADSANGTTASAATVALPAAPTLNAATGITSTNATLSWNSVAGADSYTLQRLSTAGAVLAQFTLTGTSRIDTGLQAGGEYDYRVRSETSLGGSSAWSNLVRVNATPAAQLAPTLDPRADFFADEPATFSWNFQTNNLNDGQVAYELEIFEVNNATAVYTSTATTANQSIELPFATLASNVDHEWRVRTRDSFQVGFGPWSSLGYFTTILNDVGGNATLLQADADNVSYSLTAGFGSEPAFVINNGTTQHGRYHILPGTSDWRRIGIDKSLATETWEARKSVNLPAGTNFSLTVVMSGAYTGTVGGSAFGLRLEYADVTEESSFMMDVFEAAPTIGIDIGGGFKKFTTSIRAKKDVSAIRLVSTVEVDRAGITTSLVFHSIDVTRSGRLLSKEHLDTDSLRGLLLTGSGYIQGTELRVQNSSGLDQGVSIFDDTISTTGDLTLAPGGRLVVEGNANSVRLIGTDHVFQEFYPEGTVGGRWGYIGYGSAIDPNLRISNDSANGGVISLEGSNVEVALNLDVDGIISTETLAMATGSGTWSGTGGTAGRNYMLARATDGVDPTELVLYGLDDSSLPGTIALRPKGTGRVSVDGSARLTVGSVTDIIGTNVKSGNFTSTYNGSAGTPTYEVGASGNGMYRSTAGASGSGQGIFFTTAGSWRVGIGDTLTAFRQPVIPSVDNAYTLGNSTYRWEVVRSAGGVLTTSDLRLKTDIEDSDLGLEWINKLRPTRYRLKDGSRPHYGFIAQEIQALIDESGDFGGLDDPTINTDSSMHSEGDPGYLSLRYEEFIAPAVKAIQELSAQVDELRAELAALKS